MNNRTAIEMLLMYKGILRDLMTDIARSDGKDCFKLDEEPFTIAIEAIKKMEG